MATPSLLALLTFLSAKKNRAKPSFFKASRRCFLSHHALHLSILIECFSQRGFIKSATGCLLNFNILKAISGGSVCSNKLSNSIF